MSMETLPVEILHRIFDHIDTQTIIFSIRSVCRLFQNVVHTYERYTLDFQSIYLTDFRLLCKLITPQKARSLILCNSEYTPNAIDLFVSTVRLQRFTRLHSLTLIDIDEFQMNIILKRINLTLLKSVSIQIRKYDARRVKTTSYFLSSIVANSALRKLEISFRFDRISWPIHCRIQCLTINNDIPFDNLRQILLCSPQLHTLTIEGELLNMKSLSQKDSFPQITSLTLKKFELISDKLESFLSLTSSLTYLKIISDGFTLDGNRWEQFIQINLCQLEKFEFFSNVSVTQKQTHEDLDVIIQSFRSPFWIEQKQWFVACELSNAYEIQIYSLPICKSFVEYTLKKEKVLVSSNSTISSWYDDLSITNNIDKISLLLNETTTGSLKNEVCYSNL
ncbi:unnamed protein product [Adineta ricciae]|uniref:F-box domain-containing protein n=1 Tax=Adineta ricciae TaxID=249248 RepID=A0A814UTI9_ADIRI|nr:unnamed protein product [Adineta ricciae]CAF1210097.1 unnamed protein product [Adineta ricciae]